MTVQQIKHIGIIGMGLIGGSFAALIKEKQSGYIVKGYDVDPAAAKLVQHGMLDIYCESIQNVVKDVDLVIIATPIDSVIETIKTVTDYASPETLITDVASVKAPIVDHLQQANYAQTIIPGHPMGGSDQIGFANASAQYLYNTHYLITPLGKVPNQFKQFLESLSFIVAEIEAQKHDQLVGMTSHLPYLMSVMLMNILGSVPDNVDLGPVLGPGIKDMTRLSQSSVDWGRSVSQANKETLMELLTAVKAQANDLIEIIIKEEWNKLAERLNNAQQLRQRLVKTIS